MTDELDFTLRVVCRKRTNMGRTFTDGKVYEARHYRNALYSVTDDLGYTRYIIPNQPCPHLYPFRGDRPYTTNDLGWFEAVKEEQQC